MFSPDVRTRLNAGQVAQEHVSSLTAKSKLSVRNDLEKFSWDDIREGNQIGKGGFSNIMQVHLESDPGFINHYALKCLRSDAKFLSNDDLFEQGAIDLAMEAEILSRLDHENIIRLYGTSDGPLETAFASPTETYFLLLELLDDSLSNRLEKTRNKTKKLNWSTGLSPSAIGKMIEDIALPVAKAMHYLHQNGVVLRDLKPDNVGFDSEGKVKLFDFGFARELHTLCKREMAGSLRYMAPEVAKGDGSSFASDVYSFGVMLYEMCSLSRPFKKFRSRDEFAEEVFDHGYRPSCTSVQSKSIRSLITSCWSHDSKDRPDFESIIKTLMVEAALNGPTENKDANSPFGPLLRRKSSCDTLGQLSSSDGSLSTGSSFSISSMFMRKQFISGSGSNPQLQNGMKKPRQMDHTKLQELNRSSNHRTRRLFPSRSTNRLPSVTHKLTSATGSTDSLKSAHSSIDLKNGLVGIRQQKSCSHIGGSSLESKKSNSLANATWGEAKPQNMLKSQFFSILNS